jgi:hypothetical protein
MNNSKQEIKVELDPVTKKIFETVTKFFITNFGEELTDEESIMRSVILSRPSLEKIVKLTGMQWLEVVEYVTTKIVDVDYIKVKAKLQKKMSRKKKKADKLKDENLKTQENNTSEIDPVSEKVLNYIKVLHFATPNNKPHLLTKHTVQKICNLMGINWLEIVQYVNVNIIELIYEEAEKRQRKIDILSARAMLIDRYKSVEEQEKIRKEAYKDLEGYPKPQLSSRSSNILVEAEDRQGVKRFFKQKTLKPLLEWQEVEDSEGVMRVVKSVPVANKFKRQGTALRMNTYEEVEVEDENGNFLKVKKFLLNEKNRVKDMVGEWYHMINNEGETIVFKLKEINTSRSLENNISAIPNEEVESPRSSEFQTKSLPNHGIEITLNNDRLFGEKIKIKNISKNDHFSTLTDISFFDEDNCLHQDGVIFDYDRKYRNRTLVKEINKEDLRPLKRTLNGYELKQYDVFEENEKIIDPMSEIKQKEIPVFKKFYRCLIPNFNSFVKQMNEEKSNFDNLDKLEIDEKMKDFKIRVSEDYFGFYYSKFII